MLAVALTGGIGSGKSALGDLFVARGATLVDSDVIARQVVEPGSAALAALVERFGEVILQENGALDRQRLADLAFVDTESVASLNAIVHPAISEELLRRREAARAGEGVCLFAIPLLTAEHSGVLDLHKVIVVDCPIDVAIDRLVTYRGFPPADAAARIASQLTREERVAMADYVVLNDADLASLEAKADELWDLLAIEATRLG